MLPFVVLNNSVNRSKSKSALSIPLPLLVLLSKIHGLSQSYNAKSTGLMPLSSFQASLNRRL